MTLIPDPMFRFLFSALTGCFAALWIVHDLVLLGRLRRARPGPLVADQRFGYAMGIVIGVLGVVGTLRFNGVL
jgi:hypothetical protein